MTRSRVIEDSAGRGVLRSVDGAHHLPTEYRFVVEIEQTKAGREWINGLQGIEARVSVDSHFALNVMLENTPLILELQDGRWFECWLSGDGLLIARTGHALHDKSEQLRSALG